MLRAFDGFGRNVLEWPSVMLAYPNDGALSRSPFFGHPISATEITDELGESWGL